MKKIAFTLVLNGMPFIEKQADVLLDVFDEWHIIEGAVMPVKDTSWCKPIGSEFYSGDKLSVDGTTEFIDSISGKSRVFVHRNSGNLWDGKLEMCNRLRGIVSDCVLMEFDVDEIWDADTLKSVTDYAQNESGFDGMLFRCNYYVGPNLVTVGDNCYGNNPWEWCRLWKVGNDLNWMSHEPPRIQGLNNFLSRSFTSKMGWTFDHYAYVLEEQLRFKENFYGYVGAVDQWKRLQMQQTFPQQLRRYLPWVDDRVLVERTQ